MARSPVGLDRLKRQLAAIPASVQAAVAASLETNATEMATAIERAAPVADGDLRNSIGWSEGEPPPTTATGAFRIRRANISPRGRVLMDEGLLFTVYAGDDKAFYARWVEFGTAPHNTAKGGGNKSFKGKGTGHPGTRPQPFFFPVVRARKKLVKGRVARAANKAIKQAAGLGK